MRALLEAPISRDRGAVPRQAHNLKVARATRAPASSLAVAIDKGYFSPTHSEIPEGLTPLVAQSRRRFGSGVDHSYFALTARGRRFDSCLAPVCGAGSSAVERLRTVIARSLHGQSSIWPWRRVRLLLVKVGSTPTQPQGCRPARLFPALSGGGDDLLHFHHEAPKGRP